MISQKQAKTICDRVLNLARRRRVEVLVEGSNHSLTRYADNAIHQNVTSRELVVSIRMLVGKKVGRATTNKLDNASLALMLDKCEAMAKVQDPDSDMLPLTRPQRYESTQAYSSATAGLSPSGRMEQVRAAVAICQESGLAGAGISANESSALALANSKGLFAFHRGTTADFGLTAIGEGHSGWARQQHTDCRQIDVEAVARRAVDKAVASVDPKELKPGEYTVIFEHAAVTDFLLFLAYLCFGAQACQEGTSFISERTGQKVFGENINIRDDAYSAMAPGMPFDFEGMPRCAVALVQKGVAAGMVHDRKTAKKAKTKSTGHALPQPNTHGPMPLNMVMEPGVSSLDEMISSTKRGLLVTHLHYTNVIDPKRLILTGMTRDGTFVVENGRISYPVKNMRFTESIPKMLSNVEQISKDRIHASAFFGGGFVVPALKVNSFAFTSSTDF